MSCLRAPRFLVTGPADETTAALALAALLEVTLAAVAGWPASATRLVGLGLELEAPAAGAGLLGCAGWPPPLDVLDDPWLEVALELADWFVVDDCWVDWDWPPDVPEPASCTWLELWLVELELEELALAEESLLWLEEPSPEPELTRPSCMEFAREFAFWLVAADCVADWDWPPEEPAPPTWVWSASCVV
jgi:hypothetical protein